MVSLTVSWPKTHVNSGHASQFARPGSSRAAAPVPGSLTERTVAFWRKRDNDSSAALAVEKEARLSADAQSQLEA